MLIEHVLTNSWQHESLNRLSSLLSVSKTRAKRIRDAAREQSQQADSPAEAVEVPGG